MWHKEQGVENKLSKLGVGPTGPAGRDCLTDQAATPKYCSHGGCCRGLTCLQQLGELSSSQRDHAIYASFPGLAFRDAVFRLTLKGPS